MATSEVTVAHRSASALDGVTSYHWLVVFIASCGWLFDCMDQRLFVLARESALSELLRDDPARLAVARTYSGYATTSMILGWATGGIIFGMMSDKIGRVKTMVATLLVYSGFTGLSGLAGSWVDFTIYRFLVGLGVGGMFGAATALVAESVPSGFRAVALGAEHRFVELCRRLIAAAPREWRARTALARYLTAANQPSRAIELLFEALEHNPHALAIHQVIWNTLSLLDLPKPLVARYIEITRQSVFYLDPHVCIRCRYRSTELLWQCPHCHEWNTFVEERITPATDTEAEIPAGLMP